MIRKQKSSADEADLEALRELYAALGPGVPLEFERLISGDGSPASEQWYEWCGRVIRGRGMVMPLAKKHRLSGNDLTPPRLFLLPPGWELTRTVLSELNGRLTDRGDLLIAKGTYYCRPHGSAETDSLSFLHLWTMWAGHALRFESFLDGHRLQRVATLAGCPDLRD